MNENVVYLEIGKFSIPTDTSECSEVIWSVGKSCRKCPRKDCYRNGWLKPQVDKDNKKIVENRRKERELLYEQSTCPNHT